MTQRPLCSRLISFTGFYEAQEGGISGPIRFSIEPGNSARSSARLTFQAKTRPYRQFLHFCGLKTRFREKLFVDVRHRIAILRTVLLRRACILRQVWASNTGLTMRRIRLGRSNPCRAGYSGHFRFGAPMTVSAYRNVDSEWTYHFVRTIQGINLS